MKKIVQFYKDCWNGIDQSYKAKDAFGVWWRATVVGSSGLFAAMLFIILAISLLGFYALWLFVPVVAAGVAAIIASDV